jgi:hypothetical protein
LELEGLPESVGFLSSPFKIWQKNFGPNLENTVITLLIKDQKVWSISLKEKSGGLGIKQANEVAQKLVIFETVYPILMDSVLSIATQTFRAFNFHY